MRATPDSFADLTLTAFCDRLASPDPIPGGGSASAVAAGIGASLVVMVARLSMDRPKYAAYAVTHERAVAEGENARRRFLQLADEDAAAYGRFADALKRPRETPEQHTERALSLREAAREATEVPMDVVRTCREAAALVESLAGRSNLNASSDLDVAGLLLLAAARGAGENVLINLPRVEDEKLAGRLTAQLDDHLYWIDHAVQRTREMVGKRDLRDPEDA